MAVATVGRSIRLFLYLVVITLSIASFALIVHDLKDVFGTSFCKITGTFSNDVCNYGIAANVIIFVFALFMFVWVLAGAFMGGFGGLLMPVELGVTGFNTIWAMIWAIVISAKVTKSRTEKVNAVLGFAWVDFGLLLICVIMAAAMDRGDKSESSGGDTGADAGGEAEPAEA